MTTGEKFGPYQLQGLVGRGGMGEVFRAFDTLKQRTVAVKRLSSHLASDVEFQARFRRESEVAARLREAHVIPIHDYGEIDGQMYIDMRLVDGADVDTLVAREGALQAERAVRIVAQVASALDAAHEDDLVHRDVKPSNILLTDDDFAYLVDFGIAAPMSGARLTVTGTALGTMAYMAPELFDGAHQRDKRVDVYSLACVLYKLLTGRRPFEADGLMAMMYAHVNGTPPPPSRVARVSPAFDEVLAKGMAKNPDERYQRAGDLADGARRALTISSLTVQMPHLLLGRPNDPTSVGQVAQQSAAQPPTSRPPQVVAPNPLPETVLRAPSPSLHAAGPGLQGPPLPPPPSRSVRTRNRIFAVAGAVLLVAALTFGGIVVFNAARSTGVAGPAAPTAVPAQPLAAEPYVDPEGRFSIKPPAGWEEQPLTPDYAATFTSPTPTITDFNTGAGWITDLTVSGSATDMQLVELLPAERSQLLEAHNANLTLDEPFTLADGTPGHLLASTYLDPGPQAQVSALRVVAVRGGTKVVATCTALTSYLHVEEATLRATLSTLKFGA